jgi:serine/threonine-protein kinase HipA
VRSADRRDLALEVGRQGRRASRGNLLSECVRFGFTGTQANQLIDQMKALVAQRWQEVVKAHGGSEADLAAIALAFEYPGFEYA